MFFKKLLLPACCIFLLTVTARAQESLSADELFTSARKTAFDNKDYPGAIRLCRQALLSSPGYTDIRVFLGRLYFWNKQEDSARITLDAALQQSPQHEDAALAAASIAYFTDRYEASLEYANKGLQHHPASKELLLQKAKTLTALRKYKEAAALTAGLLKAHPSFTEARSLADRIKDYTALNKISISFDHTHFKKQFADGWQLASLDYTRQTKAGSFTGRVNYGNRYGEGGVQLEADAYPRIAKNMYAYVSVGYSPDMPVFPKFRSGFSLYVNLPHGFEIDGGFRYLNFDNDTWIYTGSAGKYFRNYWFNLRAYVTPANSRISHSYSLTTRYYTGGADDYLSLTIGTGLSPDDRSQAILLNSNYKLISRRIAAGYRFSIKQFNILSFNAGYANVEYLPKTRDDQWNASIGYQRRF